MDDEPSWIDRQLQMQTALRLRCVEMAVERAREHETELAIINRADFFLGWILNRSEP